MQNDQIGCMLNDISVDLPVIDNTLNFKKAMLQLLVPKKKEFDLGGSRVIRALNQVTLQFNLGDRVGVIGPNGAGKTTLLRLLSGAYYPTSGSMKIFGRVTSILNIGVGMDYDMTGYDNIQTCCLLLGMDVDTIEKVRPEIVEFSGLNEFIHMPVRTYSSGMMLRLSFAIATSLDPDILLIDEIIGVGDAIFAQKAKERIERLIEGSGMLVIASHDEGIIKQYCNKVAFLENGKLKYFGDVEKGLDVYREWRNSITH